MVSAGSVMTTAIEKSHRRTVDARKAKSLGLVDAALDHRLHGLDGRGAGRLGDGGDELTVDVVPDDVAVLIPTSGTTGRSKLVMQTQRAYAWAGEGFPSWVGLRSDDVVMTGLPLFHINAPAYSVLGSLSAGAGLVLLSSSRSLGNVCVSDPATEAVEETVLAERPELQQALRSDHDRIPNFVEETLRVESPVKADFRMARRTTTIGDVEVKAGTPVMLLNGAANRDPRRFECPAEFQVDRSNAQAHIAFVYAGDIWTVLSSVAIQSSPFLIGALIGPS